MSFELVNAEVRPLTPQLAEEFRNLPASPTERELNPNRIKHLREKAEAGQLISFHWSTANLGGQKLRMNGQHSSNMLCALNGQFPKGLKVHLDEYKVSDKASLALLFRQFDDRKSGRTPNDVAGAYQGLFEELSEIPKPTAKIGAEGTVWYRRQVEGLPAPSGDDAYTLFNETGLHEFLHWLGELFSIKTPELKRVSIVGAMYGTFSQNEGEARKFWASVARGGVEFEDNAPATILDAWLKNMAENKRSRPDLRPGNYYQACVYAWNAHREGRALQSIKYDDKKGLISLST